MHTKNASQAINQATTQNSHTPHLNHPPKIRPRMPLQALPNQATTNPAQISEQNHFPLPDSAPFKIPNFLNNNSSLNTIGTATTPLNHGHYPTNNPLEYYMPQYNYAPELTNLFNTSQNTSPNTLAPNLLNPTNSTSNNGFNYLNKFAVPQEIMNFSGNIQNQSSNPLDNNLGNGLSSGIGFGIGSGIGFGIGSSIGAGIGGGLGAGIGGGLGLGLPFFPPILF